MGFMDRFFGPPSPEKFATMLLDRLRQAGDRRQGVYDKDDFRLVFTEDGKQAGILNLRNLYGEFLKSPKNEHKAWWSRAVRAMLSHNIPTPDEFEDARLDLRPIVRTRSYVESLRLQTEIEGETFKEIPYQPVGDHLMACLVYDLPASMMYLNQEQLDQWGVTFYEAMEVARQNLAETECSVAAIGDKLFLPMAGDSYDASRLLLVDRVEAFEVAGQPVALAVNTNNLLIAGSDDDAGLGMMADLAEKLGDEPRPLCSIPMRLDQGEWCTWLPPAEHPEGKRFKIMQLKYLAGEYEDQRKQLQKLYEVRGIDHFVASFSALEQADRAFSYSVWPPIPTHLPATDVVFFVSEDPPVRLRAPWENVVNVVGHMMQLEDRYPTRWFVEEFPTSQDFKAMGAEGF
jgi:hypothetical protein